jgi:hypothetical protein
MNLLEETKEAIITSKHIPEEITFIGSITSGYNCSWEEFEVLADKEYNASYGAAEVAQDLKIIFEDNTYLERGEYDGSEWWEFTPILTIPTINKRINSLFAAGVGWEDLIEINEKVKEVKLEW